MKVVVNNTDQNSIKEKADMQKGNPNKTKHWFFKKINKIDNSPGKTDQEKKIEKTQIIIFRSEKTGYHYKSYRRY